MLVEQDVMESLKKNEAVYAKFEQRQAEKKQHLKDTRLKKDSRQKEVEMRRRQILEDNKVSFFKNIVLINYNFSKVDTLLYLFFI